MILILIVRELFPISNFKFLFSNFYFLFSNFQFKRMNFHTTNISTLNTFCVTQFRGIVASFTPGEYRRGHGAGSMGQGAWHGARSMGRVGVNCEGEMGRGSEWVRVRYGGVGQVAKGMEHWADAWRPETENRRTEEGD